MPPPDEDDPRAPNAEAVESIIATNGKGIDLDAFDRRPPTTVEAAETAVLGAMILSSSARAGALGMLDADDFSREAHRAMFETLSEMHKAGDHIDNITANDALACTDRLDVVGGLGAVWALTDPYTCPSPHAWKVYATIVSREGRRRRGIRILRKAIQRLEAGDDPATVASELAVAT